MADYLRLAKQSTEKRRASAVQGPAHGKKPSYDKNDINDQSADAGHKRRIRRLVKEGMAEHIARIEVLGDTERLFP